MLAGSTWRNREELVKSQDSWLATFPACCITSVVTRLLLKAMKGRPDTFLSLMEIRRSWMVDTCLFRVRKGFPTTFVDTFLRHGCQVERMRSVPMIGSKATGEGLQ